MKGKYIAVYSPMKHYYIGFPFSPQCHLTVTVASFFGVRYRALCAPVRLYGAERGAAVCMCSGLRDTIRLHMCHYKQRVVGAHGLFVL